MPFFVIIDYLSIDDDTAFVARSTHDTGIIAVIGIYANARGMATNINIRTYNWRGDKTEMIAAAKQ